jgi:hypothetical protein
MGMAVRMHIYSRAKYIGVFGLQGLLTPSALKTHQFISDFI